MKHLKYFIIFENNIICKAKELTGNVKIWSLTEDEKADQDFYFTDLQKVNPDFYNFTSQKLYLKSEEIDSSSIDIEKSEQFCQKLGCDCIVSLRPGAEKKLISVEEWNQNVENDDKLSEFADWLKGMNIELGPIITDFKNLFDEIMQTNLTSEEKAHEMAAYIDEKLETYDNYMEIVDYLEEMIEDVE